MSDPEIGVKEEIFQVETYIKKTASGIQTLAVFRVHSENPLEILGSTIKEFRGRGNVQIEVPRNPRNPDGHHVTGVEFPIEASSVLDAFEKYPAALKRAGDEVQEDTNKQIAAMQIQQGIQREARAGIVKP